MTKLFLSLLSLAALALGQDGTPVTPSVGPPPTPFQLVYGYTGSNLTSICYAPSTDAAGTGRFVRQVVAIASATNANPVVFTVTAGHGMNLSTLPSITISGATSGWTGVNGTFVATPLSTTTFSIPVNSTTFGALSGTLVFHTSAPLLNQYVWAVQQYAYNVSNAVISVSWLYGSTGFQARCTDAGSTTIANQ